MTDTEIYELIEDAVVESCPELLDLLRREGRETPLFGRHAPLDSLALVALIAAVETRLRDATDRDLLLVNEDAMSRRNSPFRTVGSLGAYIAEMVA